MSEKMKVVAITGDHEVSVKEVRRPVPEKNQVLVHVRACALCTWEQRMFTRDSKVPLPFVGGHELVGEICALGEGVDEKAYPLGSRVAVRLVHECGECYFCRVGHPELCAHLNDVDMSQMDIPGTGGMSEYLNVGVSQVYFLNQDMPDQTAVFAEPLACVLNSIEKGRIEISDDVVVIGGGIMGLLHVMAAKLCGARVILSEPDQSRRELALELGADMAIDPLAADPVDEIKRITGGRGAEVVFNTTPVSAVAGQALKMAAPMGRVVMYSSQHPDKPVEVSPGWLYSANPVITGAVNPSVRSFLHAVQLLNKGLIDPAKLFSGEFGLDDAQKAFEAAIRPDTFRIAIRMV